MWLTLCLASFIVGVVVTVLVLTYIIRRQVLSLPVEHIPHKPQYSSYVLPKVRFIIYTKAFITTGVMQVYQLISYSLSSAHPGILGYGRYSELKLHWCLWLTYPKPGKLIQNL